MHRQVGVGIVVTSGSLCGVMVAHWPGMPEMWIQFPLYAPYFPFSSQARHWCDDEDPVQATHCMVVEATLTICQAIACMCAIVSIKRLTIPRGKVL